MADRLLTIAEVAERLNCQPSYVRTMLMYGRLPKIKLGPTRQSAVRIAESDLEAFLEKARAEGRVQESA